MGATIEFKTSTTAEIDVPTLARVFWNLSDEEQADFFHELGLLVEAHEQEHINSYGMCEPQWCYMASRIKERSETARNMYMALSAFAFDYWPQKTHL